MLGKTIGDPDGIEGAPQTVDGLGFLNVETVMIPKKTLARTQARYLETGAELEGYEIHLGVTTGADCARPWLEVDGRNEGASSADGRVRGTYLHGLFTSDEFRADFLEGGAKSEMKYGETVEQTLDALAAHLEEHMDLDLLWELAQPVTL